MSCGDTLQVCILCVCISSVYDLLKSNDRLEVHCNMVRSLSYSIKEDFMNIFLHTHVLNLKFAEDYTVSFVCILIGKKTQQNILFHDLVVFFQ